MANPNPNTSGIEKHQVRTTEQARELAAKRKGEPRKMVSMRLPERHLERLKELGYPLTETVENLLEELLFPENID